MPFDLFRKAPVEIQNSNGFNADHRHCFTAKPGSMVPAACEILMPGDDLHYEIGSLEVNLPPMAANFYGTVHAKFEAFFCPCRILQDNFKKLVEESASPSSITPFPKISLKGGMVDPDTPVMHDDVPAYFGRGTLADYLGFKGLGDLESNGQDINLPFFFTAYHKIWNDWYRNTYVQNDVFDRTTMSPALDSFLSGLADVVISAQDDGPADIYFADGISLFSLRQRNWPKGYFTSLTPQPQYGNASKVSFAVSGGTGEFTIAALRSANSLQRFLESQNIAGGRYPDQILADFGVLPADAVTDRPIYLGNASFPVYTKSVFETASSSSTRNPFRGSVGSTGGSSAAYGHSPVCDFKVTEPGVFMVLFSLVPQPMYATGMKRALLYRNYFDMPHPLLATIGNQLVNTDELLVGTSTPFGYVDRYAEAKYREDCISGLFADGESLQHFTLKRSFDAAFPPSLGSDFVEIPTTCLDDVSAVADSVSDYGCQVDLYDIFRKVSVLPSYSVPSLESHDVHTIMVDRGGRQL